ncbi:hypothetical protein C2E23DRAFT_885229 [Lenzites betulinus]|nr:hypothetical protein C2E23DRAFT_885229 [Lenzites betulinus]
MSSDSAASLPVEGTSSEVPPGVAVEAWESGRRYAQQMFPLGYGYACWRPHRMWAEDERLDVGGVAWISTDGETLSVAKLSDPPTRAHSTAEEETILDGHNYPFRSTELSNSLPGVLWGATIEGEQESGVKRTAGIDSRNVARYYFKLNGTTGSFLATERAEHRFVPHTARDALIPHAVRRLLTHRDAALRNDPGAAAAEVEQRLLFVTGTVKAARYYAAHVEAAPGLLAVPATLNVSLNEWCEYESSELQSLTALPSTLFVNYCKIKSRGHHARSHDRSRNGDRRNLFDPVQTVLEYILQECEEVTLAIASDADVLALFPNDPPSPADLQPDALARVLARCPPRIAMESVEAHTVGRLQHSQDERG